MYTAKVSHLKKAGLTALLFASSSPDRLERCGVCTFNCSEKKFGKHPPGWWLRGEKVDGPQLLEQLGNWRGKGDLGDRNLEGMQLDVCAQNSPKTPNVACQAQPL